MAPFDPRLGAGLERDSTGCTWPTVRLSARGPQRCVGKHHTSFHLQSRLRTRPARRHRSRDRFHVSARTGERSPARGTRRRRRAQRVRRLRQMTPALWRPERGTHMHSIASDSASAVGLVGSAPAPVAEISADSPDFLATRTGSAGRRNRGSHTAPARRPPARRRGGRARRLRRSQRRRRSGAGARGALQRGRGLRRVARGRRPLPAPRRDRVCRRAPARLAISGRSIGIGRRESASGDRCRLIPLPGDERHP